MRIIPLVLLSAACTSATVRARESVTLDTVTADDGTQVGAFEVIAELGPEARQMEVELQLESRGFVTDASTIDITGLMGLTEVGSATANDVAEFTFSPDTAACTGTGFELESDDTCVVTVTGLVITRDVIGPNGAAVLRVFADDTFDGDSDALTANLSVVAIQPE